MIQKYFEIFRQTLIKLNYDERRIPRLLELQMELMRCGLLEYMFLLYFVPFLKTDSSKLDLNKLMETKDFHECSKDVFHSKEYKETFLKRAQFLIDMGVFE